MDLKSAESYAHAMILALLPVFPWKLAKKKGGQAAPLIAQWFKPAAWAWASDDPHDKCIKNTSYKRLELATNYTNDLYWEVELVPQLPK